MEAPVNFWEQIRSGQDAVQAGIAIQTRRITSILLAFLVHPVFHQVAIKILDKLEKNDGNYTDKKKSFKSETYRGISLLLQEA